MRDQRATELFETLFRQAENAGYHLNPDTEFTLDLVEGLLTNIDRYGYMACPCRLAEGNRKRDLDIICPCDYRDADLQEYRACYCGLYVSESVKRGEEDIRPVPERRPPDEEDRPQYREPLGSPLEAGELPLPVHRCRVCGYLCARDEPPGKCPICGATKDRFERFA
ncbi:ferredoxin:glutaredoxin reductase [Candidatus Fermentibacteria bacterium]|nr:ferredoxin:glutaredoxin reductase [Candidatus Fermentibacteria bacterium]